MAQPVWVLSVDLTTKTATFQSGMAEAARSARGAFTDIKSGSSEMGGHVSTNMFAARHSVMALSEAFGGQLPRAITAFISHIGPVGAALEAAFPFAAVALGAVLLIEHLEKLKEAGVKLTDDQAKFGTAVQMAFNTLDQRLLQSQIKADELRNDHLGALHKQLQLIDAQSMAELVHSFAEVAKAADTVFGDIQSHWYTMGIGAGGAKHALDEFQNKYASLLAQGKEAEAADLLKGTKDSAEKVLAAQQKAKSNEGGSADGGRSLEQAKAAQEASNQLKAAGVGHTENEIKAQKTLVDALNAQVGIEERVTALKKQDSSNATTSTGKEMSALAAEAAKQAAEHAEKMGEITIAIEREKVAALLDIDEASIQERLASDTHFADAELQLHMRTNAALVAALDKGGKDYNSQLKGLHEKAEEMTAQHGETLVGLQSKASEAQYRKDLQDLEQGEREKIEATETGSSARLAAIDAAVREEQAKNLTNTGYYKELENQRIETQRAADAEAAKLSAEAGKEAAESAQKMGELMNAAQREQLALADSARRVTAQQRIAEEVNAANAEYALKLAAMKQEAAALDAGSKDYQNKLKENQDREKQLVQAHENEITAIKDRAEMERNQKITSAEQRFNDTIASGLTQVLMGHKSFASMMNSLGDQVVSGMMTNAIKAITANDMTKSSDAAKAARAAYLTGESIGGPAGVILGPVFGAAAFAAVSAYQDGTDMVPGVGRGDVVPAMLEPGEGVVPGGVMDNLRKMSRSGDMGNSGTHYHVTAHFAPQVSAIDGDGVSKMLDKHADKFQKHLESSIRKLNK